MGLGGGVEASDGGWDWAARTARNGSCGFDGSGPLIIQLSGEVAGNAPQRGLAGNNW